MLDSSIIHFDKQLYNEMDQDKKKDLLQCEVSWAQRVDSKLKERGIAKVGTNWVKDKKCGTEFKIDRSGKEKNMSDKGMRHKNDSKTVKGK